MKNTVPRKKIPVQLWWCAETACGWVGERPSGKNLQCPKCKSEDVFADEHLICLECKETFYSHGEFGGAWINQQAGSTCPNCKERQDCGKFYGEKLPVLVSKPPRTISS